MNSIRKRLTYANVMSSIAVFLVLGGATAFAASQLGKNSVGSKQLKNNAVTSAKIKKNAVTAAKIKDGAITGAKVNLASLGTVPSATNATNAANAANANTVNGQTIVKIFTVLPKGATNRVIASFGGFTIRGDCNGSGIPENVVLDPPNVDSDLKSQGNGSPEGPFAESNQGIEPNEVDLTGENNRGQTTFSASTVTGTVVSGSLGYNDVNSFNGVVVCSFYGHAIVSS